jgi:type VI protein secretion system component VasK
MIVLASLVETADGIVKTFGIDWPMLIAQAINFLIVALVIWKFAFKNILSTIKEREKQIADSLVNADKIKLELEETEKQQQETLQEASLAAKKLRHSGVISHKIVMKLVRGGFIKLLPKSFVMRPDSRVVTD